MHKTLKLLLIILGVIVIAYGVYFILGRPAIPLPAYHFTVFEGNQLHDFITSTGSDEMTIRLVTNGEIEAIADETNLVGIAYTPKTLNNTVSLASKFLIPEKTQNTISTISKWCPCIRILPNMVENFFYHVIRFRLTFVFNAQ
mgnify:CR=1 FL=1